MYRISWQVLSSGFAGHGEFCLTMEAAIDCIAGLNKRYSDINHWMENVNEVAPGT